MGVFNREALVLCFPEPAEEFQITENESELLIIHRDSERYPAEISRILLGLRGDEVNLKYITIAEARQGEGFGRKLLTELYRQCEEKGLKLVINYAYYPTMHILRSLIKGSLKEPVHRINLCEDEMDAWYIEIDFRNSEKKALNDGQFLSA